MNVGAIVVIFVVVWLCVCVVAIVSSAAYDHFAKRAHPPGKPHD